MFKPTIGLEIHSELNTKSKMFCCCKNNPEEKEPNINICPVCTGQPGALPIINREAVFKIIKVGLALNCQINKDSKFDRKNYFYPDLPKSYQISQYDIPFCQNGFLIIEKKKIRIQRIHLEEDAGKLIHLSDKKYSLIDFNRAGVPLMELVTEPDLSSGKEARKFAQELQLILRYLGVSKADMEKGQLRVEVNISLSKDENLGTKVEIKNLNSFRAVEKAIDYEIKRQTEILKRGEKVVQETRGWDDKREITFSQRKKEEAQDYRYFPDPDLPTIHLDEEFIIKAKSEIPELPAEKRERFKREFALEEKIIEIFVVNKELGNYFEKVVSELRNWVKEIEMKDNIKNDEFLRLAKLAANYLTTDLQKLLKEDKKEGKELLISPENFAEFITLIYKGKISSKIGKIVLEEMYKTGKDPSRIIEEKGLIQINNSSEIEDVVKKIIKENKKAVDDYKKGKENALQFLIGQLMRETKGRVNPDIARQSLEKILKDS